MEDMNTPTCKICKRVLNQLDVDPLSLDCGGDCLACIIQAENANGSLEVRLVQRIILLESIIRKTCMELDMVLQEVPYGR